MVAKVVHRSLLDNHCNRSDTLSSIDRYFYKSHPRTPTHSLSLFPLLPLSLAVMHIVFFLIFFFFFFSFTVLELVKKNNMSDQSMILLPVYKYMLILTGKVPEISG